jgi:(p)ppGpp synthase/HD superfamily hydrolase
MENILEEIKQFADKAHGNQMRKYSPDRYIVHPIRVMETCMHYDPRLPVLAAALLHDVLEDTEVNEYGLKLFLDKVMEPGQAARTLQLVKELTDVFTKEDYPIWNRKKRKAKELERIRYISPAAQTIKYADILDNSKEIVTEDPQFAPRFLSECLAILKTAQMGNPDLYRQVLEVVYTGLDTINRRQG